MAKLKNGGLGWRIICGFPIVEKSGYIGIIESMLSSIPMIELLEICGSCIDCNDKISMYGIQFPKTIMGYTKFIL